MDGNGSRNRHRNRRGARVVMKTGIETGIEMVPDTCAGAGQGGAVTRPSRLIPGVWQSAGKRTGTGMRIKSGNAGRTRGDGHPPPPGEQGQAGRSQAGPSQAGRSQAGHSQAGRSPVGGIPGTDVALRPDGTEPGADLGTGPGAMPGTEPGAMPGSGEGVRIAVSCAAPVASPAMRTPATPPPITPSDVTPTSVPGFELATLQAAAPVLRAFLLMHRGFYGAMLLGRLIDRVPALGRLDAVALASLRGRLDRHQVAVTRLTFGPRYRASLDLVTEALRGEAVPLAAVFGSYASLKDALVDLVADGAFLGVEQRHALLRGMTDILLIDLSGISAGYAAAGPPPGR